MMRIEMTHITVMRGYMENFLLQMDHFAIMKIIPCVCMLLKISMENLGVKDIIANCSQDILSCHNATNCM